ncbi:MAG: hypothetical protein RL077_1814 [Verrucomicrobiota bacterium]
MFTKADSRRRVARKLRGVIYAKRKNQFLVFERVRGADADAEGEGGVFEDELVVTGQRLGASGLGASGRIKP